MAVPTPAAPAATALRRFGRFEILRLLGRSGRSMLWLAGDARLGQEVMLALPRRAPPPGQLGDWLHAVRRAARLDHPQLLPVLEAGEHEQWPYAVYERCSGLTLAERRAAAPDAVLDVAGWMAGVLDGLAYAHEAGASHGDLQLHSLVLTEGGPLRVLGLEVAWPPLAAAAASGAGPARAVPTLLWDGRFALLTVLLAGFGRASAEVGAVMIVGGNIEGFTRVMTTAIALETSAGNLPLALALGMVLMTIVLVVNALAQASREFAARAGA